MMHNKNTITRSKNLAPALTLIFCVSIILSAAFIAAPMALASERLSISVAAANVRSGPGTSYQTLWRMERYTPIQVVSRHGDWIFFEDFEGTQGWMFNDLVDKTPTVITKRDKGNIRSSAGTDAAIIFQAESGVPFKVIGRKGDWINIQHADGDKGWIHSSLVW